MAGRTEHIYLGDMPRKLLCPANQPYLTKTKDYAGLALCLGDDQTNAELVTTHNRDFAIRDESNGRWQRATLIEMYPGGYDPCLTGLFASSSAEHDEIQFKYEQRDDEDTYRGWFYCHASLKQLRGMVKDKGHARRSISHGEGEDLCGGSCGGGCFETERPPRLSDFHDPPDRRVDPRSRRGA